MLLILVFKPVEFEAQAPLPQDNVWFIYDLIKAGLSESTQQQHFVRDGTKQLWRELNGLSPGKERNNGLWVDGCPGVGKSTAVLG